MSRLHGNGFRRRLFQFRSLDTSCYYYYSTITAALAQSQKQKHNPHFLVDYLIKSLGFSEQEAFSSINKVNLWKSSSKDPDLVLNFLQKLGLNKAQIKSIVSTDPRVLLYDVDKTLQPKIQALQDFGISGSNLIHLLTNYKTLLGRGLNSLIIPSIENLRSLLGNDEKVVKVIMKYCSLLDSSKRCLLDKNVELLQKTGFSKENICKFILEHPRVIVSKPGRLEDILSVVKRNFGISPNSKMFYHGVVSLASLKMSTMDAKFGVFRSFGWTDDTIYSMIRKYPTILGTSEDKMKIAGKFFMEELGYTPDYLASRPAVFKYNLEKRVKPRSEILKILNEKKLKKKTDLYNVLCMSEEKFVNEYLLPYKDEIPDVYNAYVKIVGREKIGKL